MAIRTRMAPSPTGEYHIGSLRTFLYNYALAKKNNGNMVLRIEDTDKEREVEGALQRIIDVIRDYGLDWDEGPDVGGAHGPYIQSERIDIYKEHVERLIEQGHAYHCFCSAERLSNLREQQAKEGKVTKYDKQCLNLSRQEVEERLGKGEPYVVRLNVPSEEDVSWNDIILGLITINTKDIDDQILLKSDGYPTYHLAVVVDDHLMEISHVMRGVEWLPSTPKHILLYKYFGWEMPLFGHLPNLKEVGANQKLSKRFGDVHAVKFLENGYLPEAVLNFIMFLGWNPGTDKEIYTLEEFIGDFTLERIHQTDLVAFDRDKLMWYNGVYIRALSPDDLWDRIKEWAGKFSVELNTEGKSDAEVIKAVSLIQERMKTFNEFNELAGYFFSEGISVDTELLYSYAGEKAQEIIKVFYEVYNKVPTEKWISDDLDRLSHEILHEHGYKTKEAFMTVRVSVTGRNATPPLFETLEVLGKERVLKRLESVL